MKVNGAMFRDALRRWGLRLESAVKQFDGTLHAFAGETKDPQAVIAEMQRAEDAIARLQVGQARYNLAVTVKVGRGEAGKVMTLTEAVKRVGGAGRVEKLWRTASMETQDPYGRSLSRSTETVQAVRTIPVKEAVELAVKATGYAESLRAAINRGNDTELDIEGLEPVDFE
jgi:hypothetical protein